MHNLLGDLLLNKLSGDAERSSNVVEAQGTIRAQKLNIRLDTRLAHVMLVMGPEYWVYTDLSLHLERGKENLRYMLLCRNRLLKSF